MRKLKVLLISAALLVGTSVASGASTLTVNGGSLGLTIGALPPVTVPASANSIFVSSGGGSFVVPNLEFGPATTALPRGLFTGVPQIAGLTLVGFGNQTVTASAAGSPSGGFGGVGGLAGAALVNVLGLVNLSIPLGVVGNPGSSLMTTSGTLVITAIGQGWGTGAQFVTGVTSTTPNTAVVNTATLSGSDSRTPGHQGTITLVSGFQAITNAAGILPGFAIMTLSFVPEPGTLLLLGSGVAGLALLGRRRMRK
jgi:hypothetical protein